VEQCQPRVLVLDMSRVPDLEYSALQLLLEGEKRFTDAGIVVWPAALNPAVLEVARHAGLDQRLDRERRLFNARGDRALPGHAGGGCSDDARRILIMDLPLRANGRRPAWSCEFRCNEHWRTTHA